MIDKKNPYQIKVLYQNCKQYQTRLKYFCIVCEMQCLIKVNTFWAIKDGGSDSDLVQVWELYSRSRGFLAFKIEGEQGQAKTLEYFINKGYKRFYVLSDEKFIKVNRQSIDLKQCEKFNFNCFDVGDYGTGIIDIPISTKDYINSRMQEVALKEQSRKIPLALQAAINDYYNEQDKKTTAFCPLVEEEKDVIGTVFDKEEYEQVR